jgi:hypothetical protein
MNDVVDFTDEQKAAMAAVALSGGVIPRYNGAWYFHEYEEEASRGQIVKKVRDFGGARQEGETQKETCFRWFQAHGGITIDAITAIHGVFIREKSFCAILVETDKEPVAMVPGSKIIRMEHYIPNNYNMQGRLFIKGLQHAMRDIELDDTVTNLTSSMPRL